MISPDSTVLGNTNEFLKSQNTNERNVYVKSDGNRCNSLVCGGVGGRTGDGHAPLKVAVIGGRFLGQGVPLAQHVQRVERRLGRFLLFSENRT